MSTKIWFTMLTTQVSSLDVPPFASDIRATRLALLVGLWE